MKTSVAYSQPAARELALEGGRGQRTQPGSWPWFALGAVLLLFSYGAHNIPLAAWLSPVFLLRFVLHGV
jgi:hypothetical protein